MPTRVCNNPVLIANEVSFYKYYAKYHAYKLSSGFDLLFVCYVYFILFNNIILSLVSIGLVLFC